MKRQINALGTQRTHFTAVFLPSQQQYHPLPPCPPQNVKDRKLQPPEGEVVRLQIFPPGLPLPLFSLLP